MDIETYTDNSSTIDGGQYSSGQVPYLISYFDGDKAYSFYLTDFTSSSAMIKACLNSIINNSKYKNIKAKPIQKE